MRKKKNSFPKRNKKIFFLTGFPRAGNTLLTSILNQNPDIGCTPNSIVLGIMKEVFLLKTTEIFFNYPDHNSLDNILDMVFPVYYKNWNFKYIIDRGPAGTKGNFTLLKKHLKQEIKIITSEVPKDMMDATKDYIPTEAEGLPSRARAYEASKK